ncbi:sensor histidine kinase [Paraburkholderia diazotrophica]|uniref:Two-component system, NarL family, sensor kinase n=1 Tax=Paraburkholderia diazotrophica TaxID=667676 RepID=A0A1H7E7R7_9BURK|nr:histidine kinase [Paraburkholderia diazotrophica]SEK09951.1 two-component system, NarL family, sensor kinase [Paraburkholderia diazotrophica]
MHATTPPEPPVRLRDLIDAMRKLGKAMRDTEPKAAHVSDARGAALAVTTSGGAIVSMNRSAAALLGYTGAELAGKRLADIAHEDDRADVERQLYAFDANEPCRSSRTFRSFDVTLAGRTGHRMPLHVYQQTFASGDADAPLRLLLFVEPLPAYGETTPPEAAQKDAYSRSIWLTRGQQRERERLAAELHDGMGQALTLIKLMVEDARMRLRRGQADDAAQLLDAAVLQIRDTIGEMRQICGELRPLALERLGLPAALSTLCRRVEQSVETLRVVLSCGVEDSEIPEHLKADIFRIVQEALNNIVKHAAASEIRIELQRDAAHLLLSIRDDGAGYHTHPLRPDDASSNGLGLIGMQHRVEAQGGAFTMSAGDDGGTEVSARWRL